MNRPPALYRCDITHTRTSPVRNAFRHRTYLWLVDLDDLPSWGPFASFSPRDHCGDPSRTLRENLEEFLTGHGIASPAQILMLCHARVFGYVFNPLTVYWCRDAAGEPLCAVAEVHNTYGGRHRYLLRPGPGGEAEAAKDFYVSPFLPVAGSYLLSLPEPGARLDLSVRLETPGAPPFTAAVRGERRPAAWPGVLAAFLRHPFAPLAGAARIRVEGAGLYLRGVPLVPRPSPPQGEAHDHDRRNAGDTPVAGSGTGPARAAAVPGGAEAAPQGGP
ncbi:DUF1365 domain-containing protein [Actinocorallia libanotica]|uniref:DUF1365 domain-containing protein n=1 Tax=Actinocorallia libanotica TaxID=46162 RepID=A0ABP4BG76_9ACTN